MDNEETKKIKKPTKKNSNGEGTIYNNGKYWVGQVTIGRNPETGKLKRKSLYGKTRREVKAKMTELMHELNNDIYIEPTDITVKAWANYWLENFKRLSLEASTYDRYLSVVELHIIKPFGTLKLKDLTVFHIQEKLNKLKSNGISDAYITIVYTRLNSMLKQAAAVKILKNNVCDGVILPKAGIKKQIHVLTKEDQAKLVAFCSCNSSYGIYIFQVGTGMRIGETLALTWDKVDFENETVEVNQAVSEVRGHSQIVDRTKTLAGVRSIPISKTIKDLLTCIKTRQDTNANLLNLVFPSRDYTIQLSANLRTRFSSVCSKAGIQKTNIHALRHTFATRAIEQNINVKALSNILGHKDIKVTLNTYSHVLNEFKKDEMMKIDIFL